ncbi:hypothetical protein BM221_002122 [Beauveria bassiana]|uniref:Zn(2)-C6 fungal-type domain-containing protein n=1 Tax=Beauveria bassiana TaxID=176275 RepID=A0A2N6NXN2_BEABA|nr:hypothetical protein BM221_002122 [Beauveria bassiana]
MLLYTKRALPKIPKKRSRAGRPVCARCKEADQECVYGPPRPRQRRTAAQIEAESALAESASTSSNLVVRQNGVAEPSLSPPTPKLNDRSLGAIVGDVNELAELADNDLTTSTAADTRDVAGLDTRAPHASALTKWSSASTTHRPRRHAGAFYATPHLELNMPLFSEFTTIKGRRGLLDHFARVLSRLIVLREDAEGGNPFQRLVLPMSRRSPAVASAIYALSSAHLEFRGAGGAAADVGGSSWTSIEFHSEAARNLAGLIEKGAEGNQNELLAAVILLIYYEVAFRFYDVIAALSFRTPTLSPAPAPGGMGHLLPFDSRGTPQPAGSADTLLGMATSLWPIVHRLSNLGALKDRVLDAASIGNSDRAAQLRAELDAEAAAIEAALVAWEPERLSSPDQDANTTTAVVTTTTTGPLRGIFSNARAYRHSSLVHLYRSIRGLRREDATVQRHMRASLACCVEAVESAGPMGALLWPLFVAACEARTEEDRALATRAFAGIDKHQGMANIEQSWQIVREVWRRADVAEAEAEAEAEGGEGGGAEDMGESRIEGGKILGGFGEEDLWRQVCKDMGLAVVFG